VQSRETAQRIISQQLVFELKRGLFGRKKDKRMAIEIIGQCGTQFGKAAECFAAASGAEEKSRLHGEFLTQRHEEAKAQRKNNWQQLHKKV
jgi:hypothetical protein